MDDKLGLFKRIKLHLNTSGLCLLYSIVLHVLYGI